MENRREITTNVEYRCLEVISRTIFPDTEIVGFAARQLRKEDVLCDERASSGLSETRLPWLSVPRTIQIKRKKKA